MTNLLEKLRSGFNQLIDELTGKERAVSIDTAYWLVWDEVDKLDGYPWLLNLYFEDNGQLFAIVQADGKLYKTMVTISNGEAMLTEPVEVKLDFPEVTQSRFTVRRQADGRWRWISISAAAVLNRVGEIDSRELFDSFIENAEETGNYPIRQFFHAGETFRTGIADFLARDEYLLITSGLYDTSEIAEREVAARQKEPDYWGDSIGFTPSVKPEMLEVEDGVTIPVYTRGVIEEISTLPESQAASWMTATPTITQEVNRMLNERQKEAFVKLFDGDEGAADTWLAENAGERNRSIEDSGMITREGEPETAVAADPETTDQPPAATEQEFIVDDEFIDLLATRMAERMGVTGLNERLDTLERQLTEMRESALSSTQEITGATEEIRTRLDALEQDDEAKRNEWLADLPARSKLKITHRPRTQEPAEPAMRDKSEMAEVAGDTLSKMKLEKYP